MQNRGPNIITNHHACVPLCSLYKVDCVILCVTVLYLHLHLYYILLFDVTCHQIACHPVPPHFTENMFFMPFLSVSCHWGLFFNYVIIPPVKQIDWGITGRCDLITYRTQALQSLSVIMEPSQQWRDYGTSSFLRCWQSFIPRGFIWQSLASHLTVSCVRCAKCCFLTAPHVIFHACFEFVRACRAGQSLLSNVKKKEN